MKTQRQLWKMASNRSMDRSGFTMLEMVASVAVMSILVVGMSSSIFIVTRSLDTGTGPAAKTLEAADAADRFIADLNVAIAFTEQTANAVTFTVPDRDGDGMAETIRYAWTGIAGDPLTRLVNGGVAVAITPDVQQFNLSYQLRTVGPPTPPPEVEGSEQILIFHDNAPGGSMSAFNVNSSSWAAEYFFPTFPGNAVSWKITRAKVHVRKSFTSNGVISVEIRTADGSLKPTATVLGQASFLESSLPGDSSYIWIEVPIGGVQGLDPTVGLCLVVKHVSGSGNSCIIEYEQNGSPMTPNCHWMTTSNSGSSWSTPNDTRDMRFYVYGTVTTQ